MNNQTKRPLVRFCMEWVPSYRETFYTLLEPALNDRGIEMDVIHGAPPASRRARKDSVRPPWATFIPNREIQIRGNEVTWQPVWRAARDADLLIVQQEAALPFTYLALAHRRLGGPRVAMWGHGAHFNEAEANSAAEALKKKTLPLADWFFAYSERAGTIAESVGLARDRITVVNNSRNSDALHADTSAVDPELSSLLETVVARSNHIGWMVSALDEWKRLPFLLETLDEIRSRVGDFEFFVLGQGDEQTMEDAVATRPWLHVLGSRFAADKAAVGHIADMTIHPGLIGLHAIDAFAFRTPMVTTELAYHSHEFDYLVDGENARILEEDATAAQLADVAAHLFDNPEVLDVLKAGCEQSAKTYTVEAMVERFANGIEAALDLA